MPLYSLKLPPAPLVLGHCGTLPDPEEDEALKPARRQAQPAQTPTLEQPQAPPLQPQPAQAAQMVKRYTDPAEQQQATAWLRSQIPHNTTRQPPSAAPGVSANTPCAAWDQPAQRSRAISSSAWPQTAQPAHPAATPPPPDLTRGEIPHNTISNQPQAAQTVMRPGALTPEKQLLHADLNRLLSPSATAPQTPQEQARLQQLAERTEFSTRPPASAPTAQPATSPAQPPAPPPRPARGGMPANSVPTDARQVEMARRSGAVIEGGRIVPHPDGKGGMLHHTGFVQTFDPNAPQQPASYLQRYHPELGTTFHYRDDHGSQHPIPASDIRRVADASGQFNYHFNVNGRPVTVPEGDKPLFQVDATNGKRFTQAADGSRLDIGSDPNAAAQAGIAPREAAALKSRDDKLARGSELSRQLQEKQAQAAAAQQRLAAAHQAVTAADQTSGPDSQQQRIRVREERIAAEDDHAQQQLEVQKLQDQHDAHYRALVADQRARHAEIGWLKGGKRGQGANI